MFKNTKKAWAITAGAAGLLLTLLLTATHFGNSYASMINKELGISTSKIVHDENAASDEDTEYFKSDFLKADGTRDDDALTAWQKKLCEQIEGEGAVLVKNSASNGLPLAKGAGVTCFGRASSDIIYGGTGSGQVDTANAATVKSALTDAGFRVNNDMIDWYADQVAAMKEAKTNRSTPGMFAEFTAVPGLTRIAEVPASDVANNGVSMDGFKDAAVVILGRSGGEGSDLAFGEFADGTSYFELQESEKELLKYVAQQGFGKIVVLINSSNAMALNWLDVAEYKIDSCLWIGGPGQYGMNAVAKILNGDVNPSGRFVDTYSASSLSAPAMKNFGAYTWSNADKNEDGTYNGKVGGVEIDGAPGDLTKVRYSIHYMVEQESIYVGYKYYETRYEDVVLGNGNANGTAGVTFGTNWDYSKEVNYPFGYGLSYTTFSEELKKVDYNSEKDVYTLTVNVKNEGSVKGKHAVQVYAQQPYTAFDREHGIEKSAIQLCGYGKTSEIEAGASETLTIEVDGQDLITYDSKVNKTYIQEAGTYYLAIGEDAHDALNNVLAKKGKTTANGMTKNGDADKVYAYEVSATDASRYAYSKANRGVKITNQFDDADLNAYDVKTTYLTRNDWQGTYPQGVDVLEANSKIINGLQYNYTPDKSKSDIILGSKDTAYSIVMMKGADYDDPNWESLLNQLTLEEMAEIVGHAGYGTQQITSINLPATIQADGPQGIKGQYAGGSTVAYTSEPVMAATFNKQILSDVGKSMGEDALRISNGKVSGWYGPAMNIHRTPYSGRNFEYYSEDGFLTGKCAALEVATAQQKGLSCYIKHFALNDFETYRQATSTFVSEQAIREIYLKGFQYAVEQGGATSLMSSFNRIGTRWAGAHKGLLTNVLREEWGFKGVVLTDAVMANRHWMHPTIGLEAGNDCWLSSGNWLVEPLQNWAKEDAKLLKNMRTSCKNFLYAYVNSTVVNGLSSADKVVAVTPAWQVAVTVVDSFVGVVVVAALGLYVTTAVLSRKKEN